MRTIPSQKRGRARTVVHAPEEIQARVDKAETYLVNGATTRVCREQLEKEFKISRDRAADAVHKALIRIGDDMKLTLPHIRSLQIHRLQNVIMASIEQKKFTEAVRAESELSRIVGTRAAKQVQITSAEALPDAIANVARGMNPEMMEKIIADQRRIEAELERKKSRLNGSSNGVAHG